MDPGGDCPLPGTTDPSRYIQSIPSPAASDPSETDPIQRARERDPDAFRLLYEEHVGRIYALCLRLARDPGDADEMVQDTFVRAWEKLPELRGDSAFGTWLFRIAVNVAMADRRATIRRSPCCLVGSCSSLPELCIPAAAAELPTAATPPRPSNRGGDASGASLTPPRSAPTLESPPQLHGRPVRRFLVRHPGRSTAGAVAAGARARVRD